MIIAEVVLVGLYNYKRFFGAGGRGDYRGVCGDGMGMQVFLFSCKRRRKGSMPGTGGVMDEIDYFV